jgi:hypothetical protein
MVKQAAERSEARPPARGRVRSTRNNHIILSKEQLSILFFQYKKNNYRFLFFRENKIHFHFSLNLFFSLV